MKYHIWFNRAEIPELADYPLIGEFGDLTVAEVTDSQLGDLREILIKNTGSAERFMVGEDRFFYRLTEDGAVLTTKREKWPYTAQEWERDFRRRNHNRGKEREKRDALLEKYGADAKKERGSVLSYVPGEYISKTHNLWFPYRVRYAGRPGQPLLVFFHGGGAVGTDNLRPLWEYLNGPYPEAFPWKKRRALLRQDITVLIPQSSQEGNYQLPEYIAAVRDLCERIAADAESDLSRVYCMGGSLGGHCTWLCAYMFPDFYACAMPMMGALNHPSLPDPVTPETLAHMKDMPIWASHSADDTVVPVTRDDEIVAILKGLGAPVKYTRADGKGHHYLVSYFLKTEPWAEWMFAQKKQNKQEAFPV